MRELIGVILLAMGMSIAQAQSGAIPADQQTKIRAAMSEAKTAQLTALQASQASALAGAKVGNAIRQVQMSLELDGTWEFNPNYFDAKSADFHALKFVQKAAGAPAAGANRGPGVQNREIPPPSSLPHTHPPLNQAPPMPVAPTPVPAAAPTTPTPAGAAK